VQRACVLRPLGGCSSAAWVDGQDLAHCKHRLQAPHQHVNNNTRIYNTMRTQPTANVEEARVLYESGWTYLDVRSEFEVDESGKVKNSVNVPFVIIKRQFDPETKERVIKKTDNPDFIKMVEKKFPKKDAKLIVSDGAALRLRKCCAVAAALHGRYT